MESPGQGPSSPSASSIFLPLGRKSRRGSRASVNTQTERENLTEALDHIHNAASQLDTLTVFNEFTTPPVPSSTSDNKTLVGDLQGGLSGLYSMFRASVGGVRGIVGGQVKPPDAPSTETASTVVSNSSAKNPASNDGVPSGVNSAVASKSQSPVLGTFPPLQDSPVHHTAPKSSKLSSKAGSVSSKASNPQSNALKLPMAPLTKVRAAATADPTVTEVNVNAVKDGSHHNRSNSGSLSASLLAGPDSAGLDRKDSTLHMSSGQISQDSSTSRSQSPVMLAKTQKDSFRDNREAEPARLHSLEAPLYDPLPSPYKSTGNSPRKNLPEIDTSFTGNGSRGKQVGGEYGAHASRQEGQPGNSNASLADNSPATNPLANSVSKFSADESTIHDGRTATTLATSFTMTDPEQPSAHSSKTSLRKSNERPSARASQTRLPGFGVSRMPSSEITETGSAFAPSSNSHESQPKDSNKKHTFTPRRLSDIHDSTSGFKSKLLGREFWMRDENAKDCFYCGEPFSTFRRKHHCRICGQIFDAKCTILISGVPFGQSGSVRVCRPCEAVINAPGDDSSDYSGDELQSPAIINPRTSESFETPVEDGASSMRSQSGDQVLKTPTMAIPATRRTVDGNNRRSAILEIDSDRQLTRPASSRSLRSSLVSRTHSVSHKRHQSRSQYVRNFKPYHEDRAPFQRRVAEDIDDEKKLPAFHRDNIIDPDLAQYLSDDDSSGDDEPSLFSVVNDGSLSRSGGDGERAAFGGLLAAVKKGRSRFSDRPGLAGLYSGRDIDDGSVSSSKAVNFPRSTRRRNLSVASSIHQRLPSRNPRENHQSSPFHHDHSMVPFSTHAPSSSGGFKMTRSASMRGAGAPVVELNRASLDHVRKLLRQLLHDAEVPHSHSWETALLPILLKATDDVEPNVQNGDDMDIRHYVKLKKIPGGRPADTSYVSGLVFTKNLALKSMLRSIPYPRILVVTFPLEYARQQQHFMSLEPVIRQEREYLESLVNRIAALRPTLLFVEKNVSGLALQLLEKANIATAYNVKESIIEAVSRCTQTRIITSVDRLAAAHLGQCASFDLRTYVQGSRKKTYMYISGCPKELGCTIVLRGANNDALVKIKRITEFMVYVVYNLKLETCLMRDEFAKIPTSPSDPAQPSQQPEQSEQSEESKEVQADRPSNSETTDSRNNAAMQAAQGNAEAPPEGGASEERRIVQNSHSQSDLSVPAFYEDMVEKHETKILSASPFVKFAPPYLLMRARKLERELEYLKRLRDQDFSYEPDEKSKDEKFFLITPEMIHESLSGASSKVKEVLHAVHDAEYDRALHHYQTQKRQWEAYISGNINLFDPYAHQNIVVLYSLVCTKTSVPCSGPDIFALGFYNQYGSDRMFEGDCTLGQYVEDLCHSASTACSANGCEERMFDHHRQYVHGEAQVSVFVLPHPSKLRGLQDSILMWSSCKICGNEAQAMPMSESTWKYSFGKYLEQSFFSADLHARAGVCPHDLHRDHIRYFGFKDIAIRIRYDPINLLEIIVPRPRVTWKVDKDLKLRNDLYSKTERRLARYMASVKARLKSINVDSVIPQMAQACKDEIEVLTKRVNDEHASLIKHHQERYMSTRYWEIIPLNKALLATQEKVVEWDATFAEFEKNYFPSEKDIRRLATLQLKKIFLDRDESVSSLASTEESVVTPTETDGSSTTPSGSPKMARRMTLSPQEAKNVLESVVEEHTAQIENDGEIPGGAPHSPGSPIEDAIEAPTTPTSQNQVQHLDLAIPANLAEKLSPPRMKPDQNILPENDQSTSPVSTSFEEAQKSRGISQNLPEPAIKEDDKATSPQRTSAIPRPREKTFHHGLRAKSPPLLRAHSQPVQTQQGLRGAPPSTIANLANERLKETSDEVSGTKPKKEKRFSDRLKLASLKSSKLSSGHSLIPRSVSKKASTRVSYLARHFEQLSRDFEKERIKERKQRAAQGKQSRAYPMASSKPIVEVYKNVRDAVEERGPSDDDFLSSTPPTMVSKESMSPGNEAFQETTPTKAREKVPDQNDTESRPSEESLRESSKSLSEGEGDGEDDRSEGDKGYLEEAENLEPNEEISSISPEEIPLDLKELPKHERNSLVKMLTNFWAERSASGWVPLDYPLSDADHVFADCDIIVREDEPSSLIAFALNSEDYQKKLKSIQVQDLSEVSNGEDNQAGVEQSLLRSTGTHLKYQFQEGQAKMLCKVFYAEQFDALRRKCGIADRIVESLSRCMKWDSKGGKTKSLFLKTLDERFILKSLSTTETQAFLKFAPDYFQIMSEALFHELPSAIAKMFGFYQVIVKNTATGVEYNWFLLMMENLFYDRTPTRIFDLKGSMRNRKVQSTGERNEVLLDENMVEFIYESPLFTREHSKKLLSQSVWNDTLFLARQNVMDYSLMIAIDENHQELVVGIIDCIRTYTWDKKLESWIKDRGFAGGGKNRPTVTSPKEYKSRFREAMARYVLQAPE